MGSLPPLPFHPEQALEQMLETAARAAHPDAGVRSALLAAYRAVGETAEPDMPLMLFNLATAYLTAGDKDRAAKLYRSALTFDPGMAIAHQNLSCILAEQGRKDEARFHRDQAYRQQCIFFAPASEPNRRVLVLHGCGHGNVPLQWLIPRQSNSLIVWFVEYTTPETILTMPAYDVVFNALGDADMDGPTFRMTWAFMQACSVPMLNNPRRVAETRRDRLPALLDGIAGLDVPPVRRLTSTDEASGCGMAFPLLLRPIGSHGGNGLVWIDAPQALAAIDLATADAWYLSPVRDCRSADGYWRKYRIIFVDRRPYPYHLAISSHWLVHYNSADMLSDPAKCAEELRFLQNPEAVLGSAGTATIRAIGERMDLDYAGVDFGILPDGRILVFEANATMLVHPEQSPFFAHKNPFVDRIVDAFDAMMERSAKSTTPEGQTTA